MSSTTPMRKSHRINAQPISEAHRYSAFSPAIATTPPQKAPSSAMPANRDSLIALGRDDRSSCGELRSRNIAVHRRQKADSPGKIRCSRIKDILVSLVSKCVKYGTDDASARIAQFPDNVGRIGKTRVVFAGEHDDAARAECDALCIRVELRRRRIKEYDVELGPQFVKQRGECSAR